VKLGYASPDTHKPEDPRHARAADVFLLYAGLAAVFGYFCWSQWSQGIPIHVWEFINFFLSLPAAIFCAWRAAIAFFDM
jgi:hypothetical protein